MNDRLDFEVCAAMREAARRAIMPRFMQGNPIAAEFKAHGEAVTIADRESEAILAERLAPLIPGATIVGEESAHEDPTMLGHLGSGTCWIIDPLDGTGNFAEGTGPFGILVALAQDGLPIAGWIFDPITGRMCMAQANCGAKINGISFRSPDVCRERPIVALTKLFADQGRREDLITALNDDCTMLDSPRCAADQYPRVASAEHDAAMFTRTLAWDHAAGVVFVNEAGGRAARPDGSAYRCDEPHGGLIVATVPRQWDKLALKLEQSGVALAGAALAA